MAAAILLLFQGSPISAGSGSGSGGVTVLIDLTNITLVLS